MKSDNYKEGLVNVAVLTDQDDDKLYGVAIGTGSPRQYFANFCKEYMGDYPVGRPIGRFVFELYEFPDLDSVPPFPTEDNERKNYYSARLKPALDAMSLKPKYHLPMDELLYGVMHDTMVNVIGDNEALTSQPDYISRCTEYRQAAPDLSWKILGMNFGESAVFLRLENRLDGLLGKLAEVLKEAGGLSVQSLPFPRPHGPKIS